MESSQKLQRSIFLLLFAVVTFAYTLPSLHNHNELSSKPHGISEIHDEACLFATLHVQSQSPAQNEIYPILVDNFTNSLAVIFELKIFSQSLTLFSSRAPPTLS